MSYKIYEYDVEEYDHAGITHKADKKFILNTKDIASTYGRVDSSIILMTFLSQLFKGMTNASGHYLSWDPTHPETIIIHWRKPIWKLSLCNTQEI